MRVSYLKFGDILNLHRSLERFIQTKIQPIFEAKKVPVKSINNLDDAEVQLISERDTLRILISYLIIVFEEEDID